MKTNSMGQSKRTSTFLTYFFLLLGTVVMIFPFVWMILTSSKTVSESMQIPPTIFPAQLMLDNFVEAIKSLPFLNMYINTGLMILFRVVCAVAFAASAVYLVWRHRKEHARGAGVGHGPCHPDRTGRHRLP